MLPWVVVMVTCVYNGNTQSECKLLQHYSTRHLHVLCANTKNTQKYSTATRVQGEAEVHNLFASLFRNFEVFPQAVEPQL